ncbi:MAG: M20/M25/M40 family metallo-hydrolase [Chloroflexi bacterium]|nr:MAG: M20/M25/M40 family metallo-hydrolase [Chloroflexota bacterium]
MSYNIDWEAAGQEAVEVLQRLIQFDTTNPPGNERPAADYIQHLLAQDGIESEILESAPGRANLVARLTGDGSSRPLLLLGHTDVVYADPDEWTYPPFGGEIHDGFVWGRGALDMKDLVAIEVMTLLLIKRQGIPLKRDLILLAVADEENMGHYGARWMLEHHRDKIDAEYVINEGGRGIRMDGREFYLVSTAEKGYGDLRLTARGAAGHSAMPRGVNPVVRISRALAAIDDYCPPYRLTRSVQEMFERMRGLLPLPAHLSDANLHEVLAPLFESLPDEVGRMLQFAVRDVFSPTMVNAGIKENVIPNQATANVNTRTLPGVTLDELLETVSSVVGPDIEIEVKEFHPGTESPSDTPLFDAIESVMSEVSPGCVVSPYLLPATTDSRFFRGHGMKAYGFDPVITPPDLAVTIHGKDERIAVENLRLGTERLFRVVTRVCAN